MNEYRSVLERAGSNFAPLDLELERVLRRRDRKRRNQRIAAGVVGIAVFVAAVWIVTTGGSFNRTQQPAIQPTPTPPAGTAPETAYLIDLNTGEMTPLPKSIAGSVGYAVSPDGTMVAYTSQDDAGNPQVFIASLDGTDVQQVTHDQRGAADPDWSPDGAAIAYTSGGYASRTGTSATSSCSTWRRARPRRSRTRSRRPRRAAMRSVPPTRSSRRTARPSSTWLIAATIGRSVGQGAMACGSCPSRAGRASCSSAGRAREGSRPMGQRSPCCAATGWMAGSASPTPTGRTCACWSEVLRWHRSGRPTARGSPTSTSRTTPSDRVFVVDVATGETTFVAEGNCARVARRPHAHH